MNQISVIKSSDNLKKVDTDFVFLTSTYYFQQNKITMKTFYFLLFAGAVGLFSCTQPADKQGNEPSSTNDSASENADDGNKYFGEVINEEGAISLEELVLQMQEQDSIQTKVRGTVEAVCQTKGCWMNLTVGEGEEKQELFVQFKDYGFFMPKDIAGREVIMEGLAYRSITSVEELRHYAEDDGQSEEEIAAITEPLEERKFLANGVILVK